MENLATLCVMLKVLWPFLIAAVIGIFLIGVIIVSTYKFIKTGRESMWAYAVMVICAVLFVTIIVLAIRSNR